MIQIIAGLLILVGAAFSLVAAIGINRMPDIFSRLHAASKAGTLGAGLVLLAVAIDAYELDIATRAFAAVLFLMLTTPVAAHLLGRAAYIAGVPLWSGTRIDELSRHVEEKGEEPDSPAEAGKRWKGEPPAEPQP